MQDFTQKKGDIMQPPSNIVDIYKSQGWNDLDAINADIKAGGWTSKVPAGSSSGAVNTSSNSSNIDPQTAINNALAASTAVRQFNIDSAQPQIASLGTQKANLDTQYNNLLSSVTQGSTVASNNAAAASRQSLAARGLSASDPYGTSQMNAAGVTAATPYSQLYSQTGISQAQDENAIASQIAALLAGNPSEALSTGSNINTLAQSAAQLGLSSQAQQFAQKYITIPNVGIYDVSTGQILSNTSSTGMSPSGNSILNITG